MPEQFVLHEFRSKVDKEYVGVAPNSSSVKPVHIAQAAFRTIDERYWKLSLLKRLALVSDAKGKVHGNELEDVYQELISLGVLDSSVSELSLQSLRNLMQKALSADKAVYVVDNLADSMISYTAGSKYFLTNSAIFSDAGILMASIIKKESPELANCIKSILEEANDPITKLFEPVLNREEEYELAKETDLSDIPAFKNPSPAMEIFLKGVKEGANCLAENFKKHSNHLTQLRLFNLFVIFNLIRYLTALASFYCNEKIRPILLDFSHLKPSESSVPRASEMSYMQMYRSLNRFYAWAYSELLKDYSIEQIMESSTPVYDRDKPIKGKTNEFDTRWEMAKKEALEKTSEEEKRLVFGEAIYDMLALEAYSHPIIYMKALGTDSGILYPPVRQHPNKRFVVSQDVLEMLLRCTVEPNAVITEDELRSRLWDRFGIVIGGRPDDLEKLQSNDVILQVSEDALESNFQSFAKTLQSMVFADQMADGILRIRLGGTYL